MSKKPGDPNLMTIEEAASILGWSQELIRGEMADGGLRRLRSPSGELRLSRAEVLRAREDSVRACSEVDDEDFPRG